jgi:hypothetical protein
MSNNNNNNWGTLEEVEDPEDPEEEKSSTPAALPAAPSTALANAIQENQERKHKLRLKTNAAYREHHEQLNREKQNRQRRENLQKYVQSLTVKQQPNRSSLKSRNKPPQSIRFRDDVEARIESTINDLPLTQEKWESTRVPMINRPKQKPVPRSSPRSSPPVYHPPPKGGSKRKRHSKRKTRRARRNII